MATKAGRTYSSPKNIDLRQGILRFDKNYASNPLSNDDTGYGLYINNSDQLVFWNQTGTSIIGAGGSGGTPTWETIFAADNTFTITPDATWTIAGNRSTATDVITITNAAGGSGVCLQITNAGSGADISGTGATWGITKAGVITNTGITFSAASTITSTAGDMTWTLEDNDATALKIGSAGATSILNFITTNGSEACVFGNDITLTDGLFTATSTSNTAPLLLMQNDTMTTFGTSSTEDEAAFVFSSDTITTASLLQLQLDGSALAGGFFLNCFETDAGVAVFTIGEDGSISIAGTALGTDAIGITAGDITLTAGDLLLTAGALTLTAGSEIITAGNLTITAGTIIETAQAILNANTAISVTHGVTKIANSAATTHTLADGVDGQRKTIICTVYVGDAVITPNSLANGNTITLNAALDGVTLVYLNSGWHVESTYGTTAVD